MKKCVAIAWLSVVVGVFSSAAFAATPIRVALLAHNVSSLDADETDLAGLLSEFGFVYDAVDARMIQNGTVDLSQYRVLYLRTRTAPDQYQDKTVLEKIRERVTEGANLFLEEAGLSLGKSLGTDPAPKDSIRYRMVQKKRLTFVALGKGKVVPLDRLGQDPESDQFRIKAIHVLDGDQPDFTISSILMDPSNPSPNSTFKALVTITNQGTADGDAGTLMLWANLSTAPGCNTTGDQSISVGSLPAGESKLLTIASLSAGEVGDKTLLAFVDSTCATDESDETNNQSMLPYSVRVPDFVITNVLLSPASPVIGIPFSAIVTIKNQGTGAADGGRLAVWADQASVPACGATADKSTGVGTLEAGAIKGITVTGLSVTTTGNKTLRAFVDSGCVSTELNETNNQFAKKYTATAPDFVITSITLDPIAPVAKGTFTALVTVKNQGTAASDGGKLIVWANQPGAVLCGATGDKSVSVGKLAKNESKVFTITGISADTAGPKTLRAFVDGGCLVSESNETNNQLTASYRVATGTFSQPDFIVMGISLDRALPVPNSTFNAFVTVKNQGTSAGNGGQLTVWADQSAAQNCGATGGVSVSVGDLGVGVTTSLTITGLSTGAVGSKTLRAFVDSACTTAESNETNNQLTQAYTVINTPDFVVTGIVLTPASPLPNSTFTAKVTIKNQGAVSGSGGYLDLWLDQPNTQICGASGDAWAEIGDLAVGKSKTITFSRLAAGAEASKTMRAFADSWCLTSESNEDNNQGTKAYSVSATDFVVTGVTINPSAPVANDSFAATVTVKNQGTGSGDGGQLTVWGNQATAQKCGATGDKSIAVGTLAAGASATLTLSGISAGTTEGNKTLRAFVDSTCTAPESKEDNNQFTLTYLTAFGPYTKLDSNGNALLNSATTWSCVKANKTGLIWEVKTNDGGLRDWDNSYTWYDPSQGGDQYKNGGSCTGGASCDTTGYVTAVNAVGLCGHKDWRMPTIDELKGIVDTSYSPTINPTFFPDMHSTAQNGVLFWSGSPVSGFSYDAWGVHFVYGYDDWHHRDYAFSVRLLRAGGQ